MTYFTPEELRRLFAVAYERNREHHLFLVVVLWHGLRVTEGIQIEGTDYCDGLFSVSRLKGSNGTIQPIHRDADPLFDESPVLQLAAKNRGRLFPFSRQRADQFIRKYAALAGIHPDKAHMHSLKHSTAMLLWEKEKNLGLIQNYLGHKAGSSSMCYLREVDAQKANAAVASMTI